MDHSVLKSLLTKIGAKPRYIRRVLLLQGFDLEIRDKEGVKNLAADHLSILENPCLKPLEEGFLNDTFLNELVLFYDVIKDDSP